METTMKKQQLQTKLLPIYLDKINNRIELSEDDFDKIMDFDTNAKMRLLSEYNRCIIVLNETIKMDK